MLKSCVDFASWVKSTAGTILPTTNRFWLTAKKLQQCFCLVRQSKNTWFWMGGSGFYQTDKCQKFCRSGLTRIQFLRIRIGPALKNFTVCSSLVQRCADSDFFESGSNHLLQIFNPNPLQIRYQLDSKNRTTVWIRLNINKVNNQ